MGAITPNKYNTNLMSYNGQQVQPFRIDENNSSIYNNAQKRMSQNMYQY